jgi:hypothetical protein
MNVQNAVQQLLQQHGGDVQAALAKMRKERELLEEALAALTNLQAERVNMRQRRVHLPRTPNALIVVVR